MAIGIVDRGRVVVEAWAAVLEERGNEDDAEFAGEGAETVGDRTGEGSARSKSEGSSTVQK